MRRKGRKKRKRGREPGAVGVGVVLAERHVAELVAHAHQLNSPVPDA